MKHDSRGFWLESREKRSTLALLSARATKISTGDRCGRGGYPRRTPYADSSEVLSTLALVERGILLIEKPKGREPKHRQTQRHRWDGRDNADRLAWREDCIGIGDSRILCFGGLVSFVS